MGKYDRRKLAKRVIREREDLEKLGANDSGLITRRFRATVLRDFRSGKDATQDALRAFEEQAAALLVNASIVAHIKGRTVSADLRRTESDPKSYSAYEQAKKIAVQRAKISKAHEKQLIEKYTVDAVEVAKGVSRQIEKALKSEVAAIVKEGEHIAEATSRLGALLDSLGFDDTKAPGHLMETLARTQINLAYGAGRIAANEDPAIQDILWGYEYSTVGDDRVRPNHAEYDGKRFPKEHPIWAQIMPPNGYNCRCTVIEIFNDDADTETISEVAYDDDGRLVGADDGWDFNPADLFRDTFNTRLGEE